MASSLSNLVNNPAEGTHKIKCKYRRDDKTFETFRIKYNYCDCFLEHTDFKDDLIEYTSLCCNKTYQQKFDKKLKEQFFNHYNNKFILLLPKGAFFNEYMDDWEKFNETALREEEDLYSHLR